MDRAHGLTKKTAVRNRFADFAYKPKKSTKIPFGLETTTAPLLEEILAEDNSLADSVAGLMAQAKAPGTIVSYESATNKFREFCLAKGYSYPDFSEKSVLHYVVQQDKDNCSLAALSQIKPGLTLVESLSGVKNSAFSETVDIMLTAAKRRAAEFKPPSKKAGVLPDDILHQLYPVCLQPFLEKKGEMDPILLRTYVRDVIIYFTFCRFNCYSQLRAMDLEDDGHCIRINFPKAKNDQYHNGRTTCLVENDSLVNPVKIVRAFFKLCNFKFGKANGDSSMLNCVIRRTKTGWFADGRRSVSYSTSTKNVQSMVSKVGVDPTGISDKSFKMLGVTRMLDSGAPLDDVAQHGRWLTTTMPLHYKHNSQDYKEKTASLVPV